MYINRVMMREKGKGDWKTGGSDQPFLCSEPCTR